MPKTARPAQQAVPADVPKTAPVTPKAATGAPKTIAGNRPSSVIQSVVQKATTSELDALLARIAADYPDLQFIESANFAWHAGKRHVAYKKTPAGENITYSMFALLHELGHAILEHKDYTHDIELLQLEVAAWEQARTLAGRYAVELDEEYIQDCLDTYRDWLHLRATCPTCFSRSLQASQRRYRCFNCQTEWTVSRSRLCRPYRLKTRQTV